MIRVFKSPYDTLKRAFHGSELELAGMIGPKAANGLVRAAKWQVAGALVWLMIVPLAVWAQSGAALGWALSAIAVVGGLTFAYRGVRLAQRGAALANAYVSKNLGYEVRLFSGVPSSQPRWWRTRIDRARQVDEAHSGSGSSPSADPHS